MTLKKNKIEQLNKFLSDNKYINDFKLSIENIINSNKEEFDIYNFNKYNEEWHDELKTQKIKNIKNEKFHIAYHYRELEVECKKYIDFKKTHVITKSMFIIIQNKLIFCYFAESEYLNFIKDFINKFSQKKAS